MAATAYAESGGFKGWEKLLIFFSVLLFLGSLYLYVTDYPLRRYLFNIDDEGHGQPVGTVTIKQGALRRQFNGEAEFKSVDVAEPLYDEDTIVTGSDSTATLKLEDGSAIELAPNTMVRLHFETKLSLGGISRAATVDVVAGTIKPNAATRVVIHKTARPIEVPKPVILPHKPVIDLTAVKGVELIAPRSGTELTLDRGTQVQEKPVSFTWHVSPPDRKVELTLWKLESRAPDAKRTSLYQEVVGDHDGQGVATWKLKEPGLYEWELRGPKGEPIPGSRKTSATFRLEPDFEGIEPMEPLVGGELLASSKLNGRQRKNFDITLRWKPYPGASKYQIAIKTQDDAKAKPVLDKQVQKPQYLFNKDKVYSGQIYYEVSAALKNGFIAHSALRPFVFTFLAPVLVTPVDHARITRDDLETEGDAILLTWQKTNFTEWYELQIARDGDFKSLVEWKKLPENFFIFKEPTVGKYFWRVRSSSKSVLSPYTARFDLDVVP